MIRLWGVVLVGWLLSGAAWGQTVVKYIHTDALGSVVAMTDASRNVIERREYEPYGWQLTPAVQDGPGYTGHVQDAATGLTYMQQRYYDPQIGLFLSVDPIGANVKTGSGFNRYRYAASNPYRFTDPDGRCEAPTGTRICSRNMVDKAGPIDRAPNESTKRTDMKFWPTPGHTKINEADKPREGRGEFGTPRNTSRGASTHTGIDIEAPVGATVVAAADGVVVNIQPNPSTTYGNQVVIKHGDGTYTQYAHLDAVSVTAGSPVNGGVQVGTVGRSGNTPALGDSHLHHERRIGSSSPRAAGGTVVDPLPYLSEP